MTHTAHSQTNNMVVADPWSHAKVASIHTNLFIDTLCCNNKYIFGYYITFYLSCIAMSFFWLMDDAAVIMHAIIRAGQESAHAARTHTTTPRTLVAYFYCFLLLERLDSDI
jgi:hypothetical protein